MRQYLVFAPPSGPCGRDGPEVSVVSSPLGRRRPGGPTAMNQVTRKFPLRKHDFLDVFLGDRCLWPLRAQCVLQGCSLTIPKFGLTVPSRSRGWPLTPTGRNGYV